MKFLKQLLFVLLLVISPISLRAQQAGGYDSSFSTVNANGPIFAMATTSNGYIWIGGYYNSVDNSAHSSEGIVSLSDTYFDLAVLNSDGTLDNSFNFPSYSTQFENIFGGGLYEYYVSAIAVDSNDVVFVGFNEIRGNVSVLARFDPSGSGSWTFNNSFTTNSKNQFSTIYSLAVDGSSVYVAGTYNPNFNSLHYSTTLARLDYNGNPDTSYGLPSGVTPYPSADVYQVRYLPQSAGYTNNSLLICGGFGVARVATGGDAVYAYFPTPVGLDTCAATRPDSQQLTCPSPTGEILAGGDSCPYSPDPGLDENSRIVDGLFMLRYGAPTNNTLPVLAITNNYALNSGFSLCSVEALPDGDVVLAGDFTKILGVNVNNFVHLLPDGTVDNNFVNYSGINPFDMIRQSDGKFLVGGSGAYTEPVFGGEYGFVERRLSPPPSGVFFTTQPSNQTVYAGDPVEAYAGVSSWPGLLAQWTCNGTNVPLQTNMSLYLSSTTTNNSGSYQLFVTNRSYCTEFSASSNITVTVLPPPPAPANDLFANAFVLSGTNVVTNGYVRSSSLEPGEPDHAENSQRYSVWYAWTAPKNGSVTLDVSGSDFTAALGVYTGTAVNALTLVTNNCDLQSDGEGGYYCNGVKGSVTFVVSSGTTYNIAVGGAPNAGSLGNIVLTLQEGPLPLVAVTNSSWAHVVSPTNTDLSFIGIGGGNLVINDYQTAFYSTNASNWTAVNDGFPDGSQTYMVSYVNGMFVMGGYDGLLAVSSNGLNWQPENLQAMGITNDSFLDTVYAIGLYVTIANDGTIITSPDAANWTVRTNNAAAYPGDWLEGVTYGNGVFVAVGDDGSVVTSPDGTNWTLQATEVGINYGDSIYSIAFGNGLFVAVGDEGSIVTSPDGTTWTLQASPAKADGYLNQVVFGNGRFIVVGTGGQILVSNDGTNWVQDASGTTKDLNGVAYYQNGQFVVVGNDGTILINQLPAFKPVASSTSGDGGLQFTLVGLSGATATIESTPSLNPPNWQPFLTNVFTNGSIIFSDTPNSRSRFYRAVVK